MRVHAVFAAWRRHTASTTDSPIRTSSTYVEIIYSRARSPGYVAGLRSRACR